MHLDFYKNYAVENVHYNLDEELSFLVNHENIKYRLDYAKSPYIIESHIDQLLGEYNTDIDILLARNKLILPRHIDYLIRHPVSFVRSFIRRTIAIHQILTEEQIDILIYSEDYNIRLALVNQVNLNDKHIHALSNDPQLIVRDAMCERHMSS